MSGRTDHPISIIGLPASGKTTFLAALWHLVQSEEVETKLTFAGLQHGNYQHLHEIARRWRSALEQDRTQIAGMRTVSMDLSAADDSSVRLTFPDVPGEDYQRIWEDREIAIELAERLATGAIVLLVNANRIESPRWVYDEAELRRKVKLEYKGEDVVPWNPRLAPTQVRLVELLQSLRRNPADDGPRRLAVMLSVWDRAAGEGLQPEPLLRDKLPLLHQYLSSDRDHWTWRVYGVSAQGGVYDATVNAANSNPETKALREQAVPSKRIKLVDSLAISHDLTAPLEWLIR